MRAPGKGAAELPYIEEVTAEIAGLLPEEAF
ncbi:hypothetical protein BWQ96_07188 [Gracilariopsis chorda]|uniref:Uncharacterized protein n=1 Tax=Gracilariopsis chorda TaxID=448386 RepID=A0A2V3ILY6_9FLOR|nr:hypothetical protein BWQ96_07188 [Gracilariopsis chorda]|eukprot:PXF43102.1 hypothetical protein BWQ96_07188 [Gracilariopsis chorda]